MNAEMIAVWVIVGTAVVYSAWMVWKSFRNGGEDGGCSHCDVKKNPLRKG